MPGRIRASRACWAVALALLTGVGCTIPGWVELNLAAPTEPLIAAFDTHGTARLATLADDPNVLWLEVDRRRDDGVIGGYFSVPPNARRSLALLINGASTMDVRAELGAAKDHHNDFGQKLRDVGFVTWTPALHECGVPYGTQEVDDVIELIDWLAANGAAWLGVDRVYLIGYSTGATIVNLVNPERAVTAVVSISGLSDGAQLAQFQSLYNLMSVVFSFNTGFCQLGTTLREYGYGDPTEWDALDVIHRLSDFKSPTLFVHGTADVVYVLENTIRLQWAYDQLVAAGVPIVPMEFRYFPGGSHWVGVEDPIAVEQIVQFLIEREPPGYNSAAGWTKSEYANHFLGKGMR